MTTFPGCRANCAIMLLLTSLFATPFVAAHVDMIAPLDKVEKVYRTPKPLGRLRVAYTASDAAREPLLLVDCDLFHGKVPANGLTDLPRPDWGRFFVAYSLNSLESGKLTDRPYIYIQVPLDGPPGESWEQTWVTFHFDADGKLTRRIKQFINVSPKATRVLWDEWAMGGGVSAKAALESMKKE